MKHMILTLYILILATSGGYTQDRIGQEERAYLIKTLTRLADPVLMSLSKNELKKTMPIEAKEGVTDRPQFTHLEAFGRLLAGLAPWLELGADESVEGKLRKKYIGLSLTCIRNATDPVSPDFMNFKDGKQPLVDAAFFAQALLRAPNQLWGPLDDKTKQQVIDALKSSRSIQPYNSNWLLFSAAVEAALLKFDGSCNEAAIDHAIKEHFKWYKGDGVYGDGPNFHWDYYNSFVIQPMMLEVLQVQMEAGSNKKAMYDTVLQRAVRYAAIQERMIAPDASYPPLGRSLAYRFGAFQLLSKIALMEKLPSEIKPQQVRAALYAVIKRQIEAPGTFDKNGWLTIGFYGHQPNIGEGYISTGSLYLCSQAFLILGLPADHSFWNGTDADWTSKKIWKGENVAIDHALDR
jgi:hypothetical protein